MPSTALPAGVHTRRVLAAVALVVVAAISGYWRYAERVQSEWAVLSTPRGSLRVSVADSAAERAQGLSNRSDISGDGVLLKWEAPGRHPIWMAEMRFPLDLIWLEANGRVTGILANVPVCSWSPCPLYEPDSTQEAVAVLELAAGVAAKHGIELGSMIRGLDHVKGGNRSR